MEKVSLEATAARLLETAAGTDAGRTADTVYGGADKVLRQTVIAMTAGTALSEHENPGQATVQVLSGRVRLTAGGQGWEAGRGELLVVPDERHGLEALEDAAVLLTVAKLPD